MSADKFFDYIARKEAEALATEDGKAFADSNFSVTTTGGGCMAWERYVDDTKWFIWITDSSGSELVLERDIPDCYLIGAYDPDGNWSECREAKTAAEAIAHADAMHALIVAGDVAALNMQN